MKSKQKNILVGVVAVLATALIVGGLGALTKGFRDWHLSTSESDKISEKVEDERVGLVKIDLTNDLSGTLLNETSIISFLNEDLEKPIFKEVVNQDGYKINQVYKDNGGLKFGSSSQLGSFTIDLVEDYTFNRCKIVGRNYSALNKQSGIYSCDETSIIVNGSEKQTFKTNAEDTTLIAPTQEKKFNFADSQTQLKIETEGKRCTLFSIELWTEIADVAKK